MNNWCIGFSRIFLMGILIFKGITARHCYKSLGVKGLKTIPLKNYGFEYRVSHHLHTSVISHQSLIRTVCTPMVLSGQGKYYLPAVNCTCSCLNRTLNLTVDVDTAFQHSEEYVAGCWL
jgi:hypothetical protein